MAETILICDDDSLQRRFLTLLLTKKLGYETIECASGREALTRIETSNTSEINAVLLDINMPGMDGLEILKQIRKYRHDLPVLMLTARRDTESAVKAFKAGANDFITKPPEVTQLDIALKNAIRMSTLSRELTRLKRDKEGALGFDALIGHEGGLAGCIAYGRKAAASDIAVLITGETSTGKELLARAIHGESRRVGASFVTINCSAIPVHAIESTLFGHEKGAIAGAAARSIGKLREAERGTVFLDDIHLLPAEAQVKLLRVLQEKVIEPLGASKPARVNIRVISATDHDLKAQVQAGLFREDLYFRLNALTIAMPSLRDRRQDILPIVEYFIRRISSMDALPVKTLTNDARRYLEEYDWPGNVRELEGLVHRALVLSEDDTIDRSLLTEIHDLHAHTPHPASAAGKQIAILQPGGQLKRMAQVETEMMRAALEHYEHNITRAADALGIAKSTFYRKMKDAL